MIAGIQLPSEASADAAHLDAVLHAALVSVAIIFVGCLAVLIWSVVRRRQQAESDARAARPAMMKTAAVALALLGTIDGALFVSALSSPSQAQADFKTLDAMPGAVRIELNAHQWAWDLRYAGPDGAFGTRDDVVSLNQLVVPAGAPVLVQLAATDVIHGFYVPSLRVKRDAVPGRISVVAFTANEPGTYEIACSQLCGVNHYKMRGELHVLAPEAYAAWLARASDLASRAYDPDDASAHWAWPWKAPR